MRLTVRVESDEAWICDDHGQSRRLTAQQAAAVTALWSQSSENDPGLTATMRAELAAARTTEPAAQERPVSQRRSSEDGERVPGSTKPLDSPLAAIMDQRVSHRCFGPLDVDSVGSLLFAAARIIDLRPATSGFVETHRPAPSAGARHPCDIHLLAGEGLNGLTSGAYCYDPASAELRTLPNALMPAQDALAAIGRRIGAAPPAALFLVADLERTLSRYPTGMALIWRDVGALLATLHLTATELNLNSCILGSTGAWIDQPPEAIDLGCLALGGPNPRG